MTSVRDVLVLAVGLVLLPHPSQGQRIASLTRFPAPEASTRRYPATYWVEGAVIGTGVLATTGAWAGLLLCTLAETSSDCTWPIVGIAATSGLIGGLAGALIGGMVNDPRPRPLHDHAAKAALVGAIAGAMWGFGVFTHFCLNGCNATEVRFGLSSAAVGALGGLLVGL